ncbi:GAF domain-containing protein [Kutzneria sp. NPDC052558]|uniref:GAF domain-containing protein n=1 Tax=Kutzneria sp. NPDC052558 TaxID=3364121 RepID=UPI0037C58E33
MEPFFTTLAAMSERVQDRSPDWHEVLGRVLLDARPQERPRSFLRALLDAAAVCGTADTAVLAVLIDGGRWLRVAATAGGFGDWAGRLIPVEGSVSALAIETGRAVLLGDIERDSGAVRSDRSVRVGPALVAPVWLDSRMVGVVGLGRDVGQPGFTAGDRDMLVGFAEHMGWSLVLGEDADHPTPVTAEEYAGIATRTAAELFDVTVDLSRIGASADDHVHRRLTGPIATLATAIERLHGRLRGAAGPQPDLRQDLAAVLLSEAGQQGLVAHLELPPELDIVISAQTRAEMAMWIERGVRVAAQCGELPGVRLSASAETAGVRLELRYQGRKPDADARLAARVDADDTVVIARTFGPRR